jgi:hypothetical protein
VTSPGSGGDRASRETAASEAEAPIAFDVVDALDGAASLVRRSPTLDGSVPLRVAQACVPFLEGNAFGHQVVLRDRLEAERAFGLWSIRGGERAVELGRRARAALPGLALRGLVDEAACARLGACWPADPRPRRRLAVWTGLLVRPRPHVRLRVASTANRRPRTFAVEEALVEDEARFTPLVLELAPRGGRLLLGGEVATVGALPRSPPRIERTTIAEARDLAAAHARFYDERYFATKRAGHVARTYRSLVRGLPRGPHADPREADGPCTIRLAEAGAASLLPGGPSRGAPDRLVFRNAVPLSARFDGQRVEIELEARALRELAGAVRAAWQPVAAELGGALHEGAVLYFSRYVTPHPAGEPHLFVKPPALVGTEPGTSLLVEGVYGAGWDVLRGVVASDVFHATPAVFHLWSTDQTVSIPAGEPLLEAFAVPRVLVGAPFALSRLELGA